MALSDTTPARNDYNGSGTTGPFTYSFRIVDKNHLDVLRVIIATEAAAVLTVDTDYTVAGVGDATGSVTLTAALAVTERLVILRNQAAEQSSTYTNEDFPPGRLEKDLDKLWMMLQEILETLDRCLKLPQQSLLDNQDVDVLVEGKFARAKSGGGVDWATPSNTVISTPIPVAQGGTGAVTAAAARTNLGVTALTPPIAVADGGTGSTTAGGARTNLGVASTSHEATHKSGGSDPFLSTDLLEAIVKRIRQTGSPSAGATTDLLVGAIADGQFLKRSGTGIIGATLAFIDSVRQPANGLGTVYQNLTGFPMFVKVVGITDSTTNAVGLTMYTDASVTPTTKVDQCVGSGGGSAVEMDSVNGWVLPNHYYKITGDGGHTTLSFWTEWYKA